ncbi:class I SAM-dependent methyltransferase [Atopomonas sediminilitoris]|uniref:class I SAM-dependent methyltransferase n=1 Tax=Atopomonas sediminilitoris TaxID=2919919 RepID=UPI001F4E0A56|nr:class I SAM-dependent methyltransferase [Atopomonas sediminilitoris]MCJ8170730.1 class I SAM-dependent methyltransferase [Atopomonas sediminilitoris]
MPNVSALFQAEACAYQRYRPDYPAELFAWLSQQCASQQRVLDIACGSGQASEAWRSHFDQVLACDLNLAGLQRSPAHSPVLYVQSAAERLPITDHSLDMISVAQALHWFATPTFYNEARRVLQPHGLISAWSYGFFSSGLPALDHALQHFHDHTLGAYWSAGREHVMQGYRHLPFPFTQHLTPTFNITRHWLAEELLGYLSSWSALAQYRQHHADPLPALANTLHDIWPSSGERLCFTWPLCVLLGSPA